jgi:hypothetical protein
MKRIVVVWALLLGLLPLARCQDSGVSAELSLDQNQLLPDEKMYLKLTIQNRSGRDLLLGTESNWLTFSVQGEKKELVAQLRDDRDYCTNETTIPAGLTASRDFNMTPYFDFRQPGHYSIKATIRIPQWGLDVLVPPVSFSIVNGIRLANMPDMTVGVPFLQSSNQPPVIRKFFLERSDIPGNIQLFVRVTDATGNRTWRLVPIGPYFSFTPPAVMLDRYNDLHVLHQTKAQLFTYCVIDTLGQILERQTYQYTDQRPVLRGDGSGGVAVAGGARVVTASDLPPPQTLPVVTPAATNSPGARP